MIYMVKRFLILVGVGILVACANPASSEVENNEEFFNYVAELEEVASGRNITSLEEISVTETDANTPLPRVLLVGDSRVQMIDEDLFAGEYWIVNRGVGGTTSAFALKVLSLSTERYDAIVISVGINDSAIYIPYSTTLANLEKCIQRAKILSDNVYVTTITGCCLPSTKLTAEQVTTMSMAAYTVNMHLNSLTRKTGVTLIDVSKVLRAGVSAFLSPIYSDGSGIHYNAAGYAVLHDLYVSMIETEVTE